MYILGSFWDNIGSAILESLRSLMLSICEVVYKLIVFFFDIFMMLGNGSILTNETLLEFYERIGLLIGLFMTFRVIFSLIQYVINPDVMFDKSKGLFNIVKRVIFVVVLLGTTPYLFKLAYNVQYMIIDSNIIPKVITGKNIDPSKSGETLAWYAFNSFFDYDDEAATLTGMDIKNSCPYLNTGALENNFKDDGSLLYAYNCVNNTQSYVDAQGNDAKVFVMRFDGHGIVPLIVGLVILWMIIMYTVQVGVRVVQLAYLQLIAPVPIIMYLTPKGEDTFNKWVKQCTTTYLDFFIRVAIMWFVIFIVDLLTGEDFQHFIDSVGAPSGLQLTWITIVMIIALLVFAQKIPKLFKELFPMSGGAAGFSFGLNAKKELNNTLAAGAIGAVGGAIGAAGSNAIHGYMNVKKAFQENGGIKSGKAWKAAAGAGFKGITSVAGGAVGGARAGLKTKDIGNIGNAVRVANENREKRELKAQAGYHWYNPVPTIKDKVLGFAGETTGAEKKIKEAQRQQQVLESSKATLWKSVEDDVKNGELKYSSYQFLRGIHTGEIKGKKVWLDGDGKFYANFDGENMNELNDKIVADIRNDNPELDVDSKNYSRYVTETAETDKKIKAQSKIIKGLETANRDAKK